MSKNDILAILPETNGQKYDFLKPLPMGAADASGMSTENLQPFPVKGENPPHKASDLWYNVGKTGGEASPQRKAGIRMTRQKSALVLGKGGFGTELAELLTETGLYEKVLFLDDNAPDCAGRLDDLERPDLRALCPDAFAAVGNNALRLELIDRLRAAGYRLPVFVHSRAFVCPSARLGEGTVVLPLCWVGARTVAGAGCILNAGASIDHDVVLGDGVHAAPGAIVKAGARLESCTKVDSGQVIRSPWEIPAAVR